MKSNSADVLKSDLPPTRWGKILGATPVVLTVVATLLAGLSSSEMTRAQYDRGLAAQLQSKAGDQWGYFQAKKLRSALQRSTLDLLGGTVVLHSLDRSALRAALSGTTAAGVVASKVGQQALDALVDGQLPGTMTPLPLDEPLQGVIGAIERSIPEPEIAALVAAIPDEAMVRAIRQARERVQLFDSEVKPLNQAIDTMEGALGHDNSNAEVRRAFIAARLGYDGRRYDGEARLNQSIGSLYELQVRKSNLTAERHHRRSEKFFYGMLAAQMGVVVSTLALAASNRNLLWSLAAAAGALAVAFAVYVYLFV